MLTLNLRPTDGKYRFRLPLLHRPLIVLWSLLGTRLGTWRQSCDQLVTLLDDYSQTLLSNLRRFQELGDASGAGIIRASCVNCLAHLAVLCEALGEIGPTPQTKLDTLCDLTLERLGAVSQDMCLEEHTLLDLLLGVRVPSCDGQTNTADCGCRAGILEKGTGCFRSSSRRHPSRTRHKVTTLEGSRHKGPLGFCGKASGRRNSNSCQPRKNGGYGPYRCIAAPGRGASWGEVAAWVAVGKKCGAYDECLLPRYVFAEGSSSGSRQRPPSYGRDGFKLVLFRGASVARKSN